MLPSIGEAGLGHERGKSIFLRAPSPHRSKSILRMLVSRAKRGPFLVFLTHFCFLASRIDVSAAQGRDSCFDN